MEKLLKALMIRCGEQPECTHNIVKLTAKCTAIGIKLPKCLDDISDTLTLWGTSGRCDPFVAFSEKKYAKAKEVYSELSEKLDMVLKGMEDLSEDEDQGFQPTM